MNFLVVIFLLAFISQTEADELSENQQTAIEQTKSMLTSPELRKKESNTSAAQMADQKVKELTGSPQTQEEIYRLASEVFGTLAEQTNGDPEKMNEILNQGLQNPEGFATLWTPEQKEKLHELAEKIQRTLPMN